MGPKGFTGEKYGGASYWDTEAYCLPFSSATHPPHVAEQFLRYRFNQLGKAIENAEKLGFQDGAALYPMVTMNGEECHNEWEITFEEIHRNGAMVLALRNYAEYTETIPTCRKKGWMWPWRWPVFGRNACTGRATAGLGHARRDGTQ